jgi:ABC-type antimicrobial peptide transport system permease subunit
LDLREDYAPLVYVADAQDRDPDAEWAVVVRSNQPLDQLVGEIKRAVAESDPALVLNFQVFRTMVKDGLLRERLMATLSGFFGALAALLAMVGLYGVISYMVVRRRNEIGIRMALGADRGSILAMVLREAAVLLGTGIAIGAALAVAGGSTVRALLYGLTPSDPSTLVFAALGLSAVAALASLLPAQRASRLDPMVALRDE